MRHGKREEAHLAEPNQTSQRDYWLMHLLRRLRVSDSDTVAFCNCKGSFVASISHSQHSLSPCCYLLQLQCYWCCCNKIQKWRAAISIKICFSTFIPVGVPFRSQAVASAQISQPPPQPPPELAFFKRRSRFVIHARWCRRWRTRECSSKFLLWRFSLILCFVLRLLRIIPSLGLL